MTVKLAPWEVERLAEICEDAAMLDRTDQRRKPWLKSCAESLRRQVEKHREWWESR